MCQAYVFSAYAEYAEQCMQDLPSMQDLHNRILLVSASV